MKKTKKTKRTRRLGPLFGIIGFIVLVLVFCYLYFVLPDIKIHNFPESDQILTAELNQPVSFSFLLNNTGYRNAYIETIFIYEVNESGHKNPIYNAKAEPKRDFKIKMRNTKEIELTVPSPKKEKTKIKTVGINVVYNPGFKIAQSNTVNLSWK